MAESEKKMGENLTNESKIREIFENGTQKDVDLLLAFETAPEVDEETRRLITKVREDLERNHHHLGGTGIAGSGNYRVGKTPDLSKTEGNID